MSKFRLTEISTPVAPPSGKYSFFLDSADGLFKKIDDAGVVTNLELGASAIQPGDNISLLTNDSGFITAAGAPVQSVNGQTGTVTIVAADGSVDTHSDVDVTTTTPTSGDALVFDGVNFTPVDVVQPGDNISDLTNDSGYLTSETVTSLSLGSNILTYTDENGTPTNIDLSLYLDDTNLARLVSGVLDSGTGIATFTRDDLTTFTIDMSALLDDQTSDDVPNDSTVTGTTVSDALETLDADKLSYVAPQDDVLTELPAANIGNANNRYSLRVNSAGDGYEYWQEFTDYALTEVPLMNQGTGFETFLSFTTQIPVLGNYKLSLSYRWSMNTTTTNFLIHIENGGNFLLPMHIEPKDSGGTGEVVDVIGGGTANTGTDQFSTEGGFLILENLAAGPQTYVLEFANQLAFNEATLYEAYIKIERID